MTVYRRQSGPATGGVLVLTVAVLVVVVVTVLVMYFGVIGDTVGDAEQPWWFW